MKVKITNVPAKIAIAKIASYTARPFRILDRHRQPPLMETKTASGAGASATDPQPSPEQCRTWRAKVLSPAGHYHHRPS